MPPPPDAPSPHGSPPLADLLDRARAGDPAAFDQIAKAIAPALVRYAATILAGDLEAADDVVQDALVAAWQALPDLRHPSKLRAWLFSVTHRQAVSWIRKHGARRGLLIRLDARDDDDGGGLDVPARPEPASQAAELDAATDLRRIMAWIPIRYASPITLCYLEGLGLKETARVLACSVATLKMRLHRGRAILRRRLSRLDGWTLHPRRAHGDGGGGAPAGRPGTADAARAAPAAETTGATTPRAPRAPQGRRTT